ncbi:MAG: hypothetical protein N2578_03730 [Bdellovibrionaceae bacterium]|nr:hypothetical protein [Pseudobdellovibrionaceae bacterium]
MRMLVWLTTFMLSLSGLAAHDFEAAVSEVMNLCEKSCSARVQSQPLFERGKQNHLPDQVFAHLKERAYELAQVWGDTILEGDYVTDGNTELVRVERVYLDGRFVAWRITYAEQAWDISTCRFDRNKPPRLQNCKSGSILEAAYVSEDFLQVIVDENQFADFLVDR